MYRYTWHEQVSREGLKNGSRVPMGLEKSNPLNVKKNSCRSDNLYLIGKRRKEWYQTFDLYTTQQRQPFKIQNSDLEVADNISQNPCPQYVSEIFLFETCRQSCVPSISKVGVLS